MALNETQRKNLSKLDVMEGTGIFTNNTKVDSADQPTVIISLGGLGGKTLNRLKNQIKRRVNQENNSIRLLAIDSSEADIEQLLNYGNLTKNEVLSLYDPSIPSMVTKIDNLPDYIRKWLNPDFVPSVTGQGCGGVRQNGRFVLSVPAVYGKVRNSIKEAILSAKEAAPLGRINVIFIAGISGGTGSGTFIDMAYIVHDILKTDIGVPETGYNMSAYFYLPDVQFGNGANADALKSNGYAALKELDYFYNLKKIDGVYEWPFSEGAIKNSTRNIFDFCTLVSSYAARGKIGKDGENMAVNVTVESLMAIITDAELTDSNGQPQQILTSFLDNYDTNIEQWLINGNGAQVSLFPRSANYCYNVIGYGSARIPVDAIMSYIALNMYENLLNEYHNMKELTPDYVSRLMASVGAGDISSIITMVKEYARSSYDTKNLPSAGDIRNVNDKYRAWRNGALQHYISVKNTQPFIQAIDKTISDLIKSLEVKLNTAFDERGPYFVSKTVTATSASDGVDGILKRIDLLIQAMVAENDDRRERCNNQDKLIAVLDSKAKEISSTMGRAGQEAAENYLRTAKKTIERFTIEMEIIDKMQSRLVEVRNFLIESNNKVFDVYTNVLDYIKQILSKNSELVVNSKRTTGVKGGEEYSLDVVNLDAAQANGRRLKACLDSFLTKQFLANFEEAFKIIIRDPENRPAFTDSTDKFDATKLIQKLFDKLLGQFYQEAVERFLISYYSDSQDMDNIMKLDSVMNNQEQKEVELQKAVGAICKELQNNATPLCQIIAGSIQQFAEPQKYMCCPTVLFEIFEKVAPAYFPGGIKICKRNNSFSIDVVTSHIGIPLTKIHGINDDDISYDHAVINNVRGLHLDESPNADFKELPAPFIYEGWHWVVGEHKSAVEMNNINAVKTLTDKLIGYDLIEYDVKVDHQGAEIKDEIRIVPYFDIVIDENILKAFRDNAKYEVSKLTVNRDFITSFLSASGIEIKKLPISINEKSLPKTYDNINVIVRKNTLLWRKIRKFIAEYEKLNDVINEVKAKSDADSEFQNNVTDFTNLIKAGFIVYTSGARSWKYIDGNLEKPFYNFGMKTPFERTFNLFFAFVEYVNNMDPRLKDMLKNMAVERFNAGMVNYDMPADIKTGIDGLLTDVGEYALNRELNRLTVNQACNGFIDAFNIKLPKHEDFFEALGGFYNAFNKNFD